MSKQILVKEESFYTFLEKNVRGHQMNDSCKAAQCYANNHPFFNDIRLQLIFANNGIEVGDIITFNVSEYCNALNKTETFYIRFKVIEYDSIHHQLELMDKGRL